MTTCSSAICCTPAYLEQVVINDYFPHAVSLHQDIFPLYAVLWSCMLIDSFVCVVTTKERWSGHSLHRDVGLFCHAGFQHNSVSSTFWSTASFATTPGAWWTCTKHCAAFCCFEPGRAVLRLWHSDAIWAYNYLLSGKQSINWSTEYPSIQSIYQPGAQPINQLVNQLHMSSEDFTYKF